MWIMKFLLSRFIGSVQLVQQEEAALDLQRRITQESTEKNMQAEKNFFAADRAISHYAETLDNVLESKQLLERLDAEKLVYME